MTPHWLNVGPLSVCIEGAICKATVCKHYVLSRPDLTDDDPMKERVESMLVEPLAA